MAKRGSKLKRQAKKLGISHLKMNNIRKNKLNKQGIKTKGQRIAQKNRKKAEKKVTYSEMMKEKRRMKSIRERFEQEPELIPLTAEVTGDEMLQMIDPEDLQYMIKTDARKRKSAKRKKKSIEEEYESRNFDKNPLPDNMRQLLPIKTQEGSLVKRYIEKREKKDKDGKQSEEGEGEDGEEKEDGNEEEEEEDSDETDEEEEEEKPEESKGKTTVEFLVERQQKLEDKKIQIGCLAANFLQDPEERISALSRVLKFMEETDPDVKMTVKKYAALSLLQIFHRIIPQYTIKKHDLSKKLKKETLKLHTYENHLLIGYQQYLKGLENMVMASTKDKKKGSSPVHMQLCVVGVRCLGELLTQHSHFNFTPNVIQAIVPLLNHQDDQVCQSVSSYLAKIFKEDASGELTQEVIRKIDQLVRRRQFKVRPEVFSIFLALGPKLRRTAGIDADRDDHMDTKHKLTHKEKLLRKLIEQNKAKKSRLQAKIHRKKRQIEEQMKDIREERKSRALSKFHSSIIQTIFGLYIHVLKRRPNNKLNSIVLEGLARFAHLVNIEYFADLLKTLGALMNEGTLKLRESLHCIQVVFTILAGQGQVLTLDPGSFYQYLFSNMYNINAGSNHDDIQTVIESLRQIMLGRFSKAGHERMLAFTKRLATQSLTLLPNGAIISLATIRSILLEQKTAEALLEVENEGCAGVYNDEANDPQHCNAGATSLWDLHLLQRHYHSTVRQISRHLLLGAPLQGDNVLPYTITRGSMYDLFQSYNPGEMNFNPAVPPPKKDNSSEPARKKAKKNQHGGYWVTEYMTEAEKEISQSPLSTTKSNQSVNGVKSSSEAVTLNGHVNSEDQNINGSKCLKDDMGLDRVNFYFGMLSRLKKKGGKLRQQKCEFEDFTKEFYDVERKN